MCRRVKYPGFRLFLWDFLFFWWIKNFILMKIGAIFIIVWIELGEMKLFRFSQNSIEIIGHTMFQYSQHHQCILPVAFTLFIVQWKIFSHTALWFTVYNMKIQSNVRQKHGPSICLQCVQWIQIDVYSISL